MVFHMKTTLLIPDPLFRQLKQRALESGETLSALVAELLRKGLTETPKPRRGPPLPTFDMGLAKVDVANRDALYEAMERG